MKSMNYRNCARKCLDRCEEELCSGDDKRLKYAALELRMSMEALTYDRALAYGEEFPPTEYKTWQPRKVMSVLLEIDSTSDKDSSLTFGEEEEYGAPGQAIRLIGAEKVLNMAMLKKHYDALGSYLHIQSMKQVRTGKYLDFGEIRSRCENIASFIRDVLASRVFNVTLGSFAKIECVECGKPIRKRITQGNIEMQTKCYGCDASYTIVDKGNNNFEWQPHQHEVECANDNCEHKKVVWRHEMKVDKYWTCPCCNGRNTFVLAILYRN